jgi:adenosine deaminase
MNELPKSGEVRITEYLEYTKEDAVQECVTTNQKIWAEFIDIGISVQPEKWFRIVYLTGHDNIIVNWCPVNEINEMVLKEYLNKDIKYVEIQTKLNF